MILPAAVAASDAANNRALDQFPPHSTTPSRSGKHTGSCRQ